MAADEIMTVEEVADLLRVSGRTVYEWANKGAIPCGKLGGAWRFKRSEVLKWVDANLQPRLRPAPGRDFSIAGVLRPERVIIVDRATKAEALDRLIDVLAATPEVRSRQDLAEGIHHRERLMSTGIGLGCGVPHVRLDSVSEPVMAVGIFPGGVEGYDSLDGKTVRVVFMVAAGTGQHELHLRLLAQIGEFMKDERVVDELLKAQTPAAAYAALISAADERRQSQQ